MRIKMCRFFAEFFPDHGPLVRGQEKSKSGVVPFYWVIVRTKAWLCVGADVPDAVTVTLYVLGADCVLFDVEQPASVSTKTPSNIHRALRNLPDSPSKNSGNGETMARTNSEGPGIRRLLLLWLTVMVVLWDLFPDSVEGAKLHPHPLGRPVQANDSEALKPFSGATETVKDPDPPWVTVRVPADSASP